MPDPQARADREVDMFSIFKRQEEITGEVAGDGTYKWRDGVYLCTVNNSFEADLLMSKLRAEGIPSEKKHIGSAGYLEVVFGANTIGAIELYVPAECLEDAVNRIKPIDLDDCEDDEIPGRE